jgi:hypothetical protein
MRIQVNRLRSLAYGAAAFVVLSVALVPALSGRAYAYGQVSARNIQMSSSANGATNTTYQVGFTIATTGVVQGVVVDFCSNDPIIGDTCTAPSGFTVGTPTVATTGGSNTGLGAGWTAASANSGRTLTLTNGSGGSISAAVPIIFTLSTATNPTNANTTFYARIFTFATTGNVTTWTGTANGSSTANIVDAGGVALSTTAQITVTAKVQETLTFCVYTGANCGAGGTAVGLGDTNGVLSTSGPFVDKTTKYDVATNAGGATPGVNIRFKAPLPTSGANTIATIGTTATTPSAGGTSQFGLCSYVASGANLTVVAPYAGGSGSCSGTSQTAGTGATGGAGTAQFAFNTANAATTFGESLATATAGATSTGQIAYLGNVSATQPAGIYTSTFTFIATGTY